jgi:polyhydroxyalkanoate synthase subunit PhaC
MDTTTHPVAPAARATADESERQGGAPGLTGREEPRLSEPVPLANIDRALRAAVARSSRGIAWPSLMAAYSDWFFHLATAPGKQMELGAKAVRKSARLARYAVESAATPCEPCIEPLPQDRRFRDPAWQVFPFNLVYQSFLLQQQWWWNATNDVKGMSEHHQRLISFMARQILDVVSPSNFIPTNPEVLKRTAETGGTNLVSGATDWWRDWLAYASGTQRREAVRFEPGREVACTPGKVVFRNDLIELIQYAPATPDVYAEPVLIVPSCVLKYYILDLSPNNSLVRYLVEAGHTVFMLSWRNPDMRDRDLSVDDYLNRGIRGAIDAASRLCTGRRLHAAGYCLGGTFLAAVAAGLAAADDDRLASLTLIAAETDFTEAGELSIFIDESQLAYLDDLTWEQGYLDGSQMAGAFLLLNSTDLVYSRNVRAYLMDEPVTATDLTSWNADTTRLPHRMHSEYLRALYLNNDLASSRMRVDGRPVALSDIRAPIFLIGTERDHVSPWKSVYKLHQVADTDITFCLTSGGHNVGIVNPPGVAGRHYRIGTHSAAHDHYVDPDVWAARTPQQPGSWWPAWQEWIAARSGARVAPPAMGGKDGVVLGDAPGTYVLMR